MVLKSGGCSSNEGLMSPSPPDCDRVNWCAKIWGRKHRYPQYPRLLQAIKLHSIMTITSHHHNKYLFSSMQVHSDVRIFFFTVNIFDLPIIHMKKCSFGQHWYKTDKSYLIFIHFQASVSAMLAVSVLYVGKKIKIKFM